MGRVHAGTCCRLSGCSAPPVRGSAPTRLHPVVLICVWRGWERGRGLQGRLLGEDAQSCPGSKLDPPLAKAESISDCDCASGTRYLRRGSWGERGREGGWEGNTSANSGGEEGRHEGGGGLEQRLPCTHGEPRGSRCPPRAPGRDPRGRKIVEDCLPWEGAHAGAGEECEESSP